jgi:hypothetical protein
MVSKHKNRWLRRWLVVIIFWAVPVAIVAVSEIREEMAYNAVDLRRTTCRRGARALPWQARRGASRRLPGRCASRQCAAPAGRPQRIQRAPLYAHGLPLACVRRLLDRAGRHAIPDWRVDRHDSPCAAAPACEKPGEPWVRMRYSAHATLSVRVQQES